MVGKVRGYRRNDIQTRALFVPVENQGTNTYLKAVGFASLLVPSIFDAKFQAQP
jgi:hypothetical protein